MIASMVSAKGGPISVVSGWLGKRGFGNGSHFSKRAQQRYPLKHYLACRGWCDRMTVTSLGATC